MTTTGFKLHPEVAAARTAIIGNLTVPQIPVRCCGLHRCDITLTPWQVGDIDNRRFLFNGFFEVLQELVPPVDDVDVKEFHIKTRDGHEMLARWYTKQNYEAPGSAVIYCHGKLQAPSSHCQYHWLPLTNIWPGGGFIACSIDQYDGVAKHYVSNAGVPFLMLEYRLAPDFQAPTQVHDVYDGLQWLVTHAGKLGVDPNRIAIMGDNAGGGITASLAHYIKAKKGPQISKQILVYPMLDDRIDTREDHEAYLPFVVWGVNDSITGWQSVLGDRYGKPDVTPIECPARATPADVNGLPDTYIDVGELDIFRDECLQYVSVLGRGGVSCEFHLMRDVTHAYDALAPESEPAMLILGMRYRVLKSL